MNREKLWKALGQVDERFIEESAPGKQQGGTLKRRVIRWCVCAAGLFLVVGVIVPRLLPSNHNTVEETTGMPTDTNTSTTDSNGQDYFNAEVLEVYDNYVKVKCLDVTTGAILEGTELSVTKQVYSKNPVPDMQIGDVIRVVFAVDEEGNVVTGQRVESEIVLDEGFPDWGITLSVKAVTPSGCTLVCMQSGGSPTGELQTGTDYNLIVLRDGVWQEVPEIIDNAGWNSLAYIITKEETTEFEYSWEWLYGKLPAGTYRLTKGFMDVRETGNYDTAVYWAEFVVE